MSELELRFQVLPAGRSALLKALGNRKLERVALTARYVDTADRLLARHGMALRLRQEGERLVQTLKAECPHSLERLEHNVDVGTAGLAGRREPREIDPQHHAGTAVGARLHELLARHGDPPLLETFRTEVARIRRLLRSHDALVEWSLDEGEIVAGTGIRAVSELELELKGGEPRGLHAMAREWQQRHGIWLDVVSKARRGDLLAVGREFARPVKATAPDLNRKTVKETRGDTLLRSIVAACLSQILPNATEIAGGSREPEHVHQLRIGLRRLRSATRELDKYADGLPEDWVPAVDAVFALLGKSRDRHVFLTSLAPRLERAGAPETTPRDVRGDRGADELALRDLVRGTAFQGALLRLLAFAHDRDSDAAAGGVAAPDDRPIDRVRNRLDRLLRLVTRDAKRFETMPLDEQHRVRKRLKRLRYVAEFIAPVFKTRDVAGWMEAVAAVQDALGRHIDLSLAARRFEEEAGVEPKAWFAVGWLRARSRDSARAARKNLQRLRHAHAFW